MDAHHHHRHGEDTLNTGMHTVIEGGGEGEQHHGEKKSVLKKVKDKARKIKDTIKKHGHSHDHEGGHRRGDDYQEGFEEDDEEDDDEVDDDPEVHGAPIYESSVPRSSNMPGETITNLEKPTDRREDRYTHSARDKIPQPFATTTMPNNGQPKPRVGLEEDPNAPTNTPANVLPSNYQSKVTDPDRVGGNEAGVAPLVHQLGNLNVSDTDDQGRNVHFSPEPTPMESVPEKTELEPKGQDSSNTGGMMNTFAGKVSSATSAVASKLGYGGNNGQDSNSYAQKVGETLAPVYGKVAGMGSAVVSKVYGGENGSGNQGPSMKEYLSEKFTPGDEDKALKDVITNALQKKEEKGEKKVGKVTMSKEVAAHLGGDADTKREGEDAVAAGNESSGKGVGERITDAVGLWFGKSTGIQTAKDSVAQSHVSDATSGSGGAGEGEGKKVEQSG